MTDTNHAEQQARAQAESIAAMIRAIECDWDRLEELRDMDAEELDEYDREELADLIEDAGEYEDFEDAERAIHEDPLSVQVRSGWVSLGEEMTAAEFQILLCWGGPAVRIIGETDATGEPSRARIEYQDWGTLWTEYLGDGCDADSLLAYCRHFIFGY